MDIKQFETFATFSPPKHVHRKLMLYPSKALASSAFDEMAKALANDNSDLKVNYSNQTIYYSQNEVIFATQNDLGKLRSVDFSEVCAHPTIKEVFV